MTFITRNYLDAVAHVNDDEIGV